MKESYKHNEYNKETISTRNQQKKSVIGAMSDYANNVEVAKYVSTFLVPLSKLPPKVNSNEQLWLWNVDILEEQIGGITQFF